MEIEKQVYIQAQPCIVRGEEKYNKKNQKYLRLRMIDGNRKASLYISTVP